MPSFDHTDASFAAHAPALPTPEPSLPLMGAPRWRFSSGPRQDDALYSPHNGRLFVLRRREPPIASGDPWRTLKNRDVPIQRWRPQRRVGRPALVHLVGGNNLGFRFLNRHELSEFRGLCDLPFPNRLGVRLKYAEHFVGHVDVAAEETCARL